MTTRDEAVARLSASAEPFEIRSEDVRGRRLQVFARRQHSLGRLLADSARHGDGEYLVTERSPAHLRRAPGRGRRARGRAAHRVRRRPRGRGRDLRGELPGVDRHVLGRPGPRRGRRGDELHVGRTARSPTPSSAPSRRSWWPTRPAGRVIEDPGIPVLSVEQDLPALLERYAGRRCPRPSTRTSPRTTRPSCCSPVAPAAGPRGATHSHRNVIAAVWFHLLNDAVATELGMAPPPRRWLLATPLFHIAALHNIAVIRLVIGDTAVLHLGKFDIDRVLRLVEAGGSRTGAPCPPWPAVWSSTPSSRDWTATTSRRCAPSP